MKYVALLRGINVGGRSIKMDELRACFEKLGFTAIKTVLQTGNVLFESEHTSPLKLKETIETGLTTRFKYPARVIVLPLESLRAIIDASPFAEPGSDYHSYVVFLTKNFSSELMQAADPDTTLEEVIPGDQVLYWKVKKGMTLKSSFALLLAKAKYRDFNTVRNISTLWKVIG
jgi:uncharacterized protein (DUF1697 family)